MKVNVYETVDITDEERKKISEVLGVRQASRDEIKAFLWQWGQQWRNMLGGDMTRTARQVDQAAQAPDELADLL